MTGNRTLLLFASLWLAVAPAFAQVSQTGTGRGAPRTASNSYIANAVHLDYTGAIATGAVAGLVEI